MKMPKCLEESLKTVFFWLGTAFAWTAFLCYIGFLQPKSNSLIQDPTLMGSGFLAISFLFVATSFLLKRSAVKKDKEYAELLTNGIQIQGVVEKVYLQKSIQYGRQSPYRIHYGYTYQDKQYHGKSRFLWTAPDLAAGDTITVYVDAFGRSAISL